VKYIILFHSTGSSTITGCAEAEHCYNGDFNFLFGKIRTLISCKMKIPEPIVTKFVTVDYFGEASCQTKFYENPPVEVIWAKG